MRGGLCLVRLDEPYDAVKAALSEISLEDEQIEAAAVGDVDVGDVVVVDLGEQRPAVTVELRLREAGASVVGNIVEGVGDVESCRSLNVARGTQQRSAGQSLTSSFIASMTSMRSAGSSASTKAALSPGMGSASPVNGLCWIEPATLSGTGTVASSTPSAT